MLHLHLKAWLVYSSAEDTLPVQLYAAPRGGGGEGGGGGIERHARDIADSELHWESLTSVPV